MQVQIFKMHQIHSKNWQQVHTGDQFVLRSRDVIMVVKASEFHRRHQRFGLMLCNISPQTYFAFIIIPSDTNIIAPKRQGNLFAIIFLTCKGILQYVFFFSPKQKLQKKKKIGSKFATFCLPERMRNPGPDYLCTSSLEPA